MSTRNAKSPLHLHITELYIELYVYYMYVHNYVFKFVFKDVFKRSGLGFRRMPWSTLKALIQPPHTAQLSVRWLTEFGSEIKQLVQNTHTLFISDQTSVSYVNESQCVVALTRASLHPQNTLLAPLNTPLNTP